MITLLLWLGLLFLFFVVLVALAASMVDAEDRAVDDEWFWNKFDRKV